MAIITNITKNKLIITASVRGKKDPIIYNMQTDELISWSGKPYKSTPTLYLSHEFPRTAVHILMARALETSPRNRKMYFRHLELFINTPDVLEGINSICQVSEECPKGFIKWLRENNLKATGHSLDKFNLYKERESILKKLSKDEADFIRTLYSAGIFTVGLSLETYVNLPKECRKTCMKIYRTTIKEVCWTLRDDVINFMRYICREHYDMPKNWYELLDTNRNFSYNNELIRKIRDEHYGTIILQKENRIRSIEELSNASFMVIVPKSMEDFLKEGKMQNNCVGYYYHDSIKRGEQLIYFIRKTDNPTKSYITNRFSVKALRTTETRMVNNKVNNDKDALKLIEEIDKKIRALLEE